MSKASINIIIFIVACVVLYYIGQQLISDRKVPTLGEFLASSTQSDVNATSTKSSFTTFLEAAASSTTFLQNNSSNQKSVSKSSTDTFFNLPSTSVITSKGSVKVFIANNDISRDQGLSDIKSLPNGEGALFVFDNPGKYGFWMKDMNFPLDLIWIDSNKNIVGVTKNALPSSYPFVFMPPRDVLYVIEMNAGSVASFGLTTGTFLKFSLP